MKFAEVLQQTATTLFEHPLTARTGMPHLLGIVILIIRMLW